MEETYRVITLFEKEGFPHIFLFQYYPMAKWTEFTTNLGYSLSRFIGFYDKSLVVSKTVKSKLIFINYRFGYIPLIWCIYMGCIYH